MKKRIRIRIPSLDKSVSGILQVPENGCRHILLLAHGAGAGMEHPFMAALADGLEGKGIATLRFQFSYMEEGKKRPDRPPVAHAAIKQAFGRAIDYGHEYGANVFAGGKSFGGRMVSQVAAMGGLTGAAGLVFFGFPLHAAGKPDTKRARHLADVPHRMLFLQGTRDALADPLLIGQTARKLKKAEIRMIEGADHSFRTLKSSGITDVQVFGSLIDESARFLSA